MSALIKWILGALFGSIAEGVNENVENTRNRSDTKQTGALTATNAGQQERLKNAVIAAEIRGGPVADAAARYSKLKKPSERKP